MGLYNCLYYPCCCHQSEFFKLWPCPMGQILHIVQIQETLSLVFPFSRYIFNYQTLVLRTNNNNNHSAEISKFLRIAGTL